MYRKSLLNKFMRNKHTDSLLQNSSDKQSISHLVPINGQELVSESSEPSAQDNKEALQEFFNSGVIKTCQGTSSTITIEISNARPVTTSLEEPVEYRSRAQDVESAQKAPLSPIYTAKESQNTV